MKKTILFLFIISLFVSSFLNAWDDEELFYSKVKPNIMILFDNSGSMNTIIFHPQYDTTRGYTNPSDGIWGGSSEHHIRNYPAGTYYDWHSGGNRFFGSGFWLGRMWDTEHTYPVTPLTGFEGVFVLDIRNYPSVNAHPTANMIYLFARRDGGNDVRLPGNLLNFLIYDATAQQRNEWNHFIQYGTWDTSDTTNYNGNHGMKNKVRIRVARNAVNRIIDEFWQDVRMGVFNFNTQHGGRIRYTIKNLSEGSNRNNLKTLISNTRGGSWTPISETMAEIWRYFQGAASFYPGNPATHTSPCDLYCRKNFVIIMTDGEPTQDNMTYGGVVDPLRQDYDGDGNDPGTYASNGTDYLDDLAYHMYNHDARSDLQDVQNVETYTIGFTTGGQANTLLNDTATNGNGTFHTANNIEELVRAFAAIMGKIREKSMSFSQFAAPKQSTLGKRGYTANFIPKSDKVLWEGHLKAYSLDDDGNFPVDANGVLNQSEMLWDAADKLNARNDSGSGGSITPATGNGDRAIFTWLHNSVQLFVKNNSNITTTDLGVSTSAERDNIFDVIRGTTDPHNFGYKLGDIFHFSPVMVGVPNRLLAKFDPVYKSFYEHYQNRKEVVFVGANDGMLHCFDAETGNELWAFIPPAVLKKLNYLATNDKHNYFVDGQAIVKDIRFRTLHNDYRDWRTVILFGLGYGGDSYYCIDVTNPIRPKFRWSIGNGTHGTNAGKTILVQKKGNNTTVINSDALLGCTISKPSVGILNINSKAKPTAVLSGGYDENEQAGNVSAAGKYLVAVNAWNGDVIKEFIYDSSNSNSKKKWANDQWLYSTVASPTLIDKNNDRTTDTIYQADIGGNIWKIDVSSNNSLNWKPKILFKSNGTINGGVSNQGFFIQPTVGYDNEYNIWVFAGTGYRSKPNDQTSIGKFFAFRDDGLQGPSGYDVSDLQDITAYLSSGVDDTDSDGDGYTDIQENDAGTDPNDNTDFPTTEEPWGTYLDVDPTKQGFQFTFLNGVGEKLFEPTPIYIAETIYFNTYLPPAGGGGSGGTETCDPAGDLFLYQFKLKISNGTIKVGSTGVESGRILGSGVLSGGKYKIYIGKGEVGSQTIQEQIEVDLKGIFGPIFWIEKKR